MGTAQGCSKTCRFCLRWRIEGPTEEYFPMDFVREEIKSIQEENIMIHPDWSIEDFKSFRRYIKTLNPETSTFSPLTPFPNLPLYQEYRDRLLVKEEDYERWSFGQVTIMSSNMSIRRYYYEILKTNLYVNLPLKNIKYLTKRFGIFSVFRLFRGSVNLFIKYIKLMLG